MLTITLEEKLKQLRDSFLEQLPTKVANIEAAWQVAERSGLPADSLVDLHRAAHSLAGSGATFGCPAISKLARSLELYAQEIIESGGTIHAKHKVEISQAIAGLVHAMAHPDKDSESITGQFISVPLTALPELVHRDSDGNDTDGIKARQGNLVCLLEDDPVVIEDLSMQLGHFGYKVRTIYDFDDLSASTAQAPPVAVIADLSFHNSRPPGSELTGKLPIPIIFTSVLGGLDFRLNAVRAGGSAFFSKPVNIGALVDKLDQLTSHTDHEPYRVLIVDDQPELAEYHSSILRGAGMTVWTINDPMDVTAPLADLNPDLLLVDMYMPGCTGLELAAVIRQQQALVSIPIVFLSSETDIDKQMAAMARGGDDFLTKPIQPGHLISAVSSRVERLRVLRSFMVRDSLTGLLNHTTIKEQLTIEIARAGRFDQDLAFALLDIDHFKSVNDTYGHPTGDRVIKSISRLLQQRLRKTDVIGRYGGEEFAIILPNTDGLAATRVVDELRAGFAQVRQQSDGVEFRTTFSAGIATFPRYIDAAQLNNTADKALYRAKQKGRNRVVLAGRPDTTSRLITGVFP